jgi:hypothetical protein
MDNKGITLGSNLIVGRGILALENLMQPLLFEMLSIPAHSQILGVHVRDSGWLLGWRRM